MIGMFQEVGPCEVIELSRDRLGTMTREWGWVRSSNIVFFDQPVQTGFSYDRLVNASLNLLDQSLTYPPTSVPVSQPPYTFLNGTFASNDQTATANTSALVVHSIWHFLQGFLQTFPEYARTDMVSNSTEINLFTESYGGRYGSSIGAFFEERNSLRSKDPSVVDSTLGIRLNSLGIINGWVDPIVQAPSLPNFAYQNTYSIQAISQVQQLNALSAFRGAGGCQELISACRSLEVAYDPDGSGNSTLVNNACADATHNCQTTMVDPYASSNRSIYDITQTFLDPFPSSLYFEYLNTLDVQRAIGVPINFTSMSLAVYSAFNATGDWSRGNGIEDLANLLKSGVRVALIYGDADFICNYLGGEAIPFALAAAAGVAYAPWYYAGYAPIVTNDSYIGGVVREFGNLSFTRIYDAGHLLPAYQPETAFTVFSRIITGDDISLGSPVNLSTYTSVGDANSTHQNTVPSQAEPICNIRAVNATCDRDHKNMLANGAGVIINGVLYDRESDWPPPNPSVSQHAGSPGAPPTAMIPAPSGSKPSPEIDFDSGSPSGMSVSDSVSSRLPTGVFTATGVPSVTSTSSSGAAVPTASLFAFPVGRANAAALLLGCVAAIS